MNKRCLVLCALPFVAAACADTGASPRHRMEPATTMPFYAGSNASSIESAPSPAASSALSSSTGATGSSSTYVPAPSASSLGSPTINPNPYIPPNGTR